MSRKTKFRAWDDEINHMYYPPNSHIAMWCNGECINLQTGKKLIPLFWTDCFDKNGKEIWECDFVKTDEGEWIGYVIFANGMFYVKDNKGGFSTFCNWDKFEVIGNIYENSELLEGK